MRSADGMPLLVGALDMHAMMNRPAAWVSLSPRRFFLISVNAIPHPGGAGPQGG